jgi:hypothetical protein
MQLKYFVPHLNLICLAIEGKGVHLHERMRVAQTWQRNSGAQFMIRGVKRL